MIESEYKLERDPARQMHALKIESGGKFHEEGPGLLLTLTLMRP
jgi:hypothetical protein